MSPPSYNFVIICQPPTNPDTLTLALIFYILSPFLCTSTMDHYIHVRYNSPSLPLSDVILPKAATVFLPTYGIGVSNMQTVLSEHTTHFTHSHDKLLQPYGILGDLTSGLIKSPITGASFSDQTSLIQTQDWQGIWQYSAYNIYIYI